MSATQTGHITRLKLGMGADLTFTYRVGGKEVKMGNTSRERGKIFCASTGMMLGSACVIEFKCRDIEGLPENSMNRDF